MSVELESAARLNALKQGIEAKTGETYPDLTDGVNALIAGFGQGGGGDTDAAFEAGRTAEYDDFWNVYQNQGKRTDYQYAFPGNGWTRQNFKPKYDLKPKYGGATYMFRLTGITGNLTELLSNSGVSLDTSGLTTNNSMFYDADGLTAIPRLDFSNCSSLNLTFSGCTALQTLSVVVGANTSYTDTFRGCSALINLTVEGTVGKNGLNLKDSASLTKDSIASVINALSTATSGLTATLSATAVNTAFETSTGTADGATSAEWLALAATKSNWTIALA